MRTTLNIDEDMLSTAKALAEQSNKTVGEVVSELMRKGLSSSHKSPSKKRNGVPLFKPTGRKSHLTIDQINELRDGE
jgi:hypothetical protein